MILWGMFSCCVVAAHTLGTMMALRFLTGAAEAFIHGTLIYLSFWYRYDELATRGALFDGASALAGAFNGLISHRIQVDLDGHNGWRACRCKYNFQFINRADGMHSNLPLLQGSSLLKASYQ